jgi:endonuclease/exonuclease/phosphatase family metal-dependent hydrolase
MRISLLQLNIEAGRKLPELITYIKENAFDIVQLQEVTGGEFSKYSDGTDIFKTLLEKVEMRGELNKTMHLVNDPLSYFGNATFYSKKLTLTKKEVVWLNPFREIDGFTHGDPDKIRALPRSVLSLAFSHEKGVFWSINTHLAWGPTQLDEPHKIEQGKLLQAYVATLDDPFVLSGDFNVWKESIVVKNLEAIAVNHATKAKITNTLNPHLHRASHLFPPGLAVDYIFTHPSIIVTSFSLVDTPDLSDHLGLQIQFEV